MPAKRSKKTSADLPAKSLKAKDASAVRGGSTPGKSQALGSISTKWSDPPEPDFKANIRSVKL